MPLLDLAQIFATARDLRHGLIKPPYSAKAMIESHFSNVLVTGEDMPREITERVEVSADGQRTILYNRKLSTTTHRVAIVHGLGHLIFDLTPTRQCSLNYRGPVVINEPLEERRAELFAGEVLVPLHDLDHILHDEPLFPADPVEKRHFDDMLDHAASTFKVPRRFLRRRVKLLEAVRRTPYFLSK